MQQQRDDSDSEIEGGEEREDAGLGVLVALNTSSMHAKFLLCMYSICVYMHIDCKQPESVYSNLGCFIGGSSVKPVHMPSPT